MQIMFLKNILAKEKLSNLIIYDNVITYCLYGLALLVPIFFTPWSAEGVDFDKQFLMVFLAVIALFAWIIKALISGSFFLNFNKIHIAMGILLVATALSAIFSTARYGSLWGWPQLAGSSLMTIAAFAIIYFLVASTFAEQEVFTSFLLLGIASAITYTAGLLQIFGLDIIPFAFAKNAVFQLVGSPGNLGFFAAMLLPLWICLAAISKTWHRYLFLFNIALSFAVLVLASYQSAWIMALAGSAIMIAVWFLRRDAFDSAWIFLPMFFLIISAFFLIVPVQIKWLPTSPVEISLAVKPTLQVVAGALRQNPLLGSGPGTFAYDFAKYKSPEFNASPLWSMEFNAGFSKALTDLATTGVLGFLAWVLLGAALIWYGAKAVISGAFKGTGDAFIRHKSLLFGAGMAVLLGFLGSFLYNPGLAAQAVWFFAAGAVVAMAFKQREKYTLKSSSSLLLAITFIFTACLIFGAGFLLFEGQHYAANVHYNKSMDAFARGNKEEAIARIKIAVSNNKGLDMYSRQLALFSLSLLQEKSLDPQLVSQKAEQEKIRQLVVDSINAANAAIAADRNNFANWSTKGYVCQNLIGLNEDAADCSIISYDNAIELYPLNPYFYFQQGNSYLVQAGTVAEGKDDLLAKARDKFNKAIEIKQDYAVAYLQAAWVAKLQGKQQDMSSALQKASEYSANNASLAFQIGLFYYQNGNWQKAEQEFSRALVLIPNYANALYYLGLTYDQLGLTEKAIGEFSKVEQLSPDNQNIKKILANLRAGKKALNGLAQQPPVPLPSPTQPEEK